MTSNQQKTHGYTGIKRIFFAAHNSHKGLKWMLQNEAAFKQETVLFILLTIATFFFDISATERLAMIAVLLLVMLVETLNTAIEAVVDRIGLERHELSGLAKDLGSLAVLMSMTIAVLVWAFILW